MTWDGTKPSKKNHYLGEETELMEKLNFHYLKEDTNILLWHLFIGSTAADNQKTTRILAVKTNPQIKERRKKSKH